MVIISIIAIDDDKWRIVFVFSNIMFFKTYVVI
jgi:hypothetical protein